MPVVIKLFAGLKAKHGPEVELEIATPAPIEAVQRELERRGLWSQGARIAINQTFATSSATVCDEDEVAVIPPVSGGWDD